MFTPYPARLLGLLLACSTASLAQAQLPAHRPRIDRAALRATRPVPLPTRVSDGPAPAQTASPVSANRPTSPSPGAWGTLIGQSTYDLQSNRAPANRMAMTGTNLSAVWTQTCSLGSSPNFTNRGIGYNLTTNGGTSFTSGPAGNCPSNFGIATQRTGWPEVTHVNGNEFVAAHTGSGIVTTKRGLGSGAWSAMTTLSFSTGTDGGTANATWPRMVSNGSSLHMVYCSNGSATVPQAPSGVLNPMLYNRSTDGGLTWDRQNVLLPGMDATNFNIIGPDNYAIGINGNTVAIATGSMGDHLVIWKSTDNGTTFTARVVIGNYTDADTLDIDGQAGGDTATVIAPDGSMSVVVGSTGKVHWFSGTQLIQVVRNASGRWVATGNYYPDAAREMWYWNDVELTNTTPVIAAQLDMTVPGGSPFQTLATGSNSTREIYGQIGPVSMPTAVTDTNGDVYAIYAGGRLGTTDDGTANGQYYRDLYVVRLSFTGNNQVQTYAPKNISRDLEGVFDGAASISEESVFPSAVHNVVNGKIHYQWMSDFAPGTALLPSSGADPEGENAIMYDAMNLASITWTPAFLYSGTSCTLAAPVLSANTPACGGTLTLSATGVAAGASYQWSGPNGFFSIQVAPQIPNVTMAAAGNYQLTIMLGGCVRTVTQNVTVTGPNATFGYGATAYCRTATNPAPTITGTTGGSFSATPAGLNLNAASGLITLASSTPGAYIITYTVGTGACQVLQARSITVTAAPQATFSYAAGNRCVGTTETLTPTLAAGSTAGTFSATPAGLSLNVATGAINLATSQTGTYTITNSVAGTAPCATVNATTTLVLLARPTAAITANGPTTFCPGGSVVLTASGGTAYLWNTGATTAAITVSSAGSYSVTALNGSCVSANAATATVTISPLPTTPITSAALSTLVLGQSTTLKVVNPQSGVTYTWTGPGLPPGGSVGPNATVTPPAIGTISYIVTARTSAGCSTTATRSVTVNTPPPSIASFTPTSSIVGGSITISGTNFTGTTTVLFNGVAAAGFSVLNSTTITATVPATASTGKLTISTAAGTTLSAGTFKITPTLSSFSPGTGSPGTTVTVSGSGFTGATAVKFGIVAATSFTVVNATTINTIVPANAVTGKIAVTTGGGTATSANNFTVGPIITGLLPTQGAPGSVVLVQGLNFVSGTTVTINGVPATTTYNSAKQLTVIVPMSATTGVVRATNPNGMAVSPTNFTVVSGVLPTITSFAPTTNVIAGTAITLTGTNFTGATLVRFNNVNAASFTVNSATSITATVPAGALSGKLYVATPAGMAQSAGSLTIIQPPTVSSLTPAAGSPGSVVLLGGSNLTNATNVQFNGVSAAGYTVNSSSQIAAVVPAGAATGKISVTTIAGTGISTANFTITSAPAPTISNLSPGSALRGATVVVTGTNFTGVTSVKLGTVAVTSYTVNSPTQVTFTVPASAVSGRLYVTAAGGMAQSPGSFSVIIAPSISSFTPASGRVGTIVSVYGTNFTGATSVTFGTTTTTSFTLVSPTRINVSVPVGATTGPIKVTNAAGTATSAATFTVTGPRLAPREPSAEPADLAGLDAYPNPTTDWVTIQVPGAPIHSVSRVELIDALGRVVRTGELTDNTCYLSLHTLPKGVYLIKAAGQTKRLVVE